MVIIRNEQLEAFQKQKTINFAETIFTSLKDELTATSCLVEDGTLSVLLTELITRARSRDLYADRDIICFVKMSFIRGLDVDEDEGIARDIRSHAGA